MKKNKEVLLRPMLCIILICMANISLTSGLKLTASAGGADCSSSTSMSYGATVDDYAKEHIKLNTEDGTLSNAYSSTGNLPYSSIQVSDQNGNYAQVSRSISGNSGTSWNYDWNTYKFSSGVGAWLSLNANNAYSITGKGYASNKEGDIASASVSLGGSSINDLSNLKNYYVNPYAYTSGAGVSQSADSATSLGTATIGTYAQNGMGDYASSSEGMIAGAINYLSDSATASSSSVQVQQAAASMGGYGTSTINGYASNYNGYIGKSSIQVQSGQTAVTGTIDNPLTSAYASRTEVWAWPTASEIKSTKTSTLSALGSNGEGDSSNFNLQITDGKITNPSFLGYGVANFAEAYLSADSITSSGVTNLQGTSDNLEKDHSTASISIPSGSIIKPTLVAYADKTLAFTMPTASQFNPSQTGTLSASASNKEGDSANFNSQITNGKITNPSFLGYGVANFAEAYLSADSITSSGVTNLQGTSDNLEKDHSTASLSIPSGWIIKPTIATYADKTLAFTMPTASQFNPSQTGTLSASASNKEGDSANFNLQVTDGQVSNPYYYAWGVPNFAQSYLTADSIASSGATTIQGTADNKEQDHSQASASIESGSIIKPGVTSYADRINNYILNTASELSSTQNGKIYASSSNYEVDSSNIDTQIANGKIKNLVCYGGGGSNFVQSYQASDSITGTATLKGTSYNLEMDYSTASVTTSIGSITTPIMASSAGKTNSRVEWIRGSIYSPITCALKADASNAEGDKSSFRLTDVSSASANINDPVFWSMGQLTSAKTYANIPDAKGSFLLMNSHAENKQIAYEGHWDSAGNWIPYNQNFGGGDFEIISYGSLTGVVDSVSKSNSINIGVSGLPSGTKTALILEPFAKYAVDNQHGKDMGSTAYPALLTSGYATTRYTDSAASKDKFSGLDKYNVVLVKSHMNPDSIALSTSDRMADDVDHSELNYNNPPSQSLVILAGCESFEKWFWFGSNLEKAVEKANLRAGYEKSVDSAWNQDSIGRLFQDMANGMTFNEANSEVWNTYRYIWRDEKKISPDNQYYNQHIVQLTPYGNPNFKL